MNDVNPADHSANYPGFTDPRPAPSSGTPSVPGLAEHRAAAAGMLRADLMMYAKLVLLILVVGVPVLIGAIVFGR